ncbi:MAG: Gfo/Idh/MocA family oxidoreductase [Thermoleophilia bacterium]|nr:Gfo/Idh/MocA family oxidoreductase [Thermoleophilia bacterium]
MSGIGIIGAGVMGRQHAASAMLHGNSHKLVGVYAHDNSQAQMLAARHGVLAFSSLEDLLSSDEIDAVIVATPTDTHREVAEAAMRAGKHVLVEKPLARTLADAQALRDIARETDRVLAVGHVIRYFPEYRTIAIAIERGDIGTPAVATFRRRCQQPDWAPDHWHTSMARSGGVVLDMMIHDVDLVRWYFGEPTRVYARCIGSDKYGGLDYALATLHVADGPICHLFGSWAEPVGFSQSAEVCGDRGMIEYDSRGRDELQLAHHGAAADAATALPPPPADARDPFMLQQADWLDEARGLGTLVNDADWAIGSMRIALAMLESQELGSPVDLTPAIPNVEVPA